MTHVVPGTHELAVDLAGGTSHDETAHTAAAPAHHTAAPAAPAPKAAPAAKIATTAPPAPPAAKVAAKPPAAAPPAPTPHAAAKPVVAAAIPANAGVLMISSKPPCEITVDGKPTHLMTPQRRLVLTPGPHTIGLVNSTQHIQNTTKVEILAGLPSRLIKDFTAH